MRNFLALFLEVTIFVTGATVFKPLLSVEIACILLGFRKFMLMMADKSQVQHKSTLAARVCIFFAAKYVQLFTVEL
jgi:hypothetical protein